MVRQKMSRLAPELARPSSADYSRVQILRKIKRDKNQLSVQSYLKKPKKKVINTQDSFHTANKSSDATLNQIVVLLFLLIVVSFGKSIPILGAAEFK